MIEIVPAHPLNAAQIGKLVHLLGVSIGDVRRCSERREAVRTIEIFGGCWQDERVLLVVLHRSLRSDQDLFSVRDTEDGPEDLTADKFRDKILFWRGIELEQECAAYLEIGSITSPSEFESAEPDCTSSLDEGAA